MFVVRVNPSGFVDRLNAEANAPEYLENAALINSCGMPVKNLGGIVVAPINNSIRNVSDIFSKDAGSIPMFRPADMDGAWLNTDSAPLIDSNFEERHIKARVYPGDIVLAIAGTIGQAARVPPSVQYGNVNGSCARIRPTKGLRAYLLAYLNSKIGIRALNRLAVGSVQRHLNLEDLPAVPVVIPEEPVKAYIGDKVRQAERLRERARELTNEATLILENLIKGNITEEDIRATKENMDRGDKKAEAVLLLRLANIDNNGKPEELNSSRKVFTTKVHSGLLYPRLDAGYYEPKFILLQQRLKDAGAVELDTLVTKVECGPFGGNAIAEDLYETSGLPFVRPVNISSNQFDPTDLVRVSREKLETFGLKIYNGASLVFGRVGVPCVSVVEGPLSISPNIIIATENKDRANIYFLYVFCSSVFGLSQLQRQLKEVAQPTTSTSAVKEILVIKPSRVIQTYIGDKAWQEKTKREFSRRLTEAAKQLVESLIEGKVSEAELKAAQEALERGDRTLDRELLGRLTRKGMDVKDEPPLFSDLDALYRALDEELVEAGNTL